MKEVALMTVVTLIILAWEGEEEAEVLLLLTTERVGTSEGVEVSEAATGARR